MNNPQRWNILYIWLKPIAMRKISYIVFLLSALSAYAQEDAVAFAKSVAEIFMPPVGENIGAE